MLVDVHCHLDHKYLHDQLDAVIDRARKAGLKYILTSGVNVTSNRNALAIARKYPDIVKFSAGLYPIDLLGHVDVEGLPRQAEPIDIEEEFKFITQHKDEVFSIGEVGLDAKFCADQMPKQKENLQKILDFVAKIKKPIILHTRKAEKDVLDMLESTSLKKVDLHCFMGNKKLIQRAADLGYSFSIPPVIVKLQHFQMLVEMVNIDQILTETDAPYLSPHSDRQNEPAFVRETIKMIAKIKKISEEEVEKNIFKNFEKIFL
ncbi:TatD family hydrolase [Candidatus Woesearchaeota archaeon]|nr:TatD family hydrolase [Candidatus Woesearchaeota archaeon]